MSRFVVVIEKETEGAGVKEFRGTPQGCESAQAEAADYIATGTRAWIEPATEADLAPGKVKAARMKARRVAKKNAPRLL